MPVNDADLDKKIRDWAVTKAKLAEAEAALEEIKKTAAGAESEIIALMDELGQTIRRVDAVAVKISSRKEGGRASWKEGYQFLFGKVNDQLKQMATDFLESTKGEAWLRRFLVKEGIMQTIWQALKDMASFFLGQLRAVGNDLDELESLVKPVKESRHVALADALIESAVKE